MTTCQRFIPTPDSAYISSLDHGNTVFADEQYILMWMNLAKVTRVFFILIGDFASQVLDPKFIFLFIFRRY